ncbi:MAG: beta-lactamase domain protein [Segetibacter sp.]|nr:beta-lactamase domain protein [Segetibacter sp.]
MEKDVSNNLPKNMFTVAPGVWGMKDVMVNFYMIQNLKNEDWFLVDAGLKWSARKIKKMAAYLFGNNVKPRAIILTHGHFDHVGSLYVLAEEWDVPIYAHTLEVPYLTDQSSYPPPDPTVGGGLLSALSFIFPKTPIDVWRHLNVLPADGTIPGLEDWKYVHTPGHAPGHISLFRESDKVLIAGDAFVTTKQESFISVLLQSKVVSGPPKYFTYDWQAAEQSVRLLASLAPITAGTGHGFPMRGQELKEALGELVTNFKQVAVPEEGRYVGHPAEVDQNGIVYLPPKNDDDPLAKWKLLGGAALVGLGLLLLESNNRKRRVRRNENLLEVEYNF